MDTSSPALIGSGSSGKVAVKRQYRSAELKRKIVEESLAPGASVARIARAHGVNANQVFAWRQRYRQGLLSAARNQAAGLLAVRVTEAAEEAALPSRSLSATAPSGTIQVELAKGTVRVRGNPDPEALRTILEVLAR